MDKKTMAGIAIGSFLGTCTVFSANFTLEAMSQGKHVARIIPTAHAQAMPTATPYKMDVNNHITTTGQPLHTLKPSDYKIVEAPQQEKLINRGDFERDLGSRINKYVKNKLSNTGESFVKYAMADNVSPFLLASIAMQETGNGTSKAIRTLDNCGGMMRKDGKGLVNYKDKGGIDACIKDMALTVKNIIRDLKRQSIEANINSIGGIYCPEGALNDPTGLNKHWIPNVTAYYEAMSKDVEITPTQSNINSLLK